jgi:hypothetical protein
LVVVFASAVKSYLVILMDFKKLLLGLRERFVCGKKVEWLRAKKIKAVSYNAPIYK